MVGRGDGRGERDGGEVVESDGIGGCRYTIDVRRNGARIVR